ncbi:hypothetical protein VTL71DRAFT_1470, partial [Oculimacula yallundae]
MVDRGCESLRVDHGGEGETLAYLPGKAWPLLLVRSNRKWGVFEILPIPGAQNPSQRQLPQPKPAALPISGLVRSRLDIPPESPRLTHIEPAV